MSGTTGEAVEAACNDDLTEDINGVDVPTGRITRRISTQTDFGEDYSGASFSPQQQQDQHDHFSSSLHDPVALAAVAAARDRHQVEHSVSVEEPVNCCVSVTAKRLWTSMFQRAAAPALPPSNLRAGTSGHSVAGSTSISPNEQDYYTVRSYQTGLLPGSKTSSRGSTPTFQSALQSPFGQSTSGKMLATTTPHDHVQSGTPSSTTSLLTAMQQRHTVGGSSVGTTSSSSASSSHLLSHSSSGSRLHHLHQQQLRTASQSTTSSSSMMHRGAGGAAPANNYAPGTRTSATASSSSTRPVSGAAAMHHAGAQEHHHQLAPAQSSSHLHGSKSSGALHQSNLLQQQHGTSTTSSHPARSSSRPQLLNRPPLLQKRPSRADLLQSRPRGTTTTTNTGGAGGGAGAGVAPAVVQGHHQQQGTSSTSSTTVRRSGQHGLVQQQQINPARTSTSSSSSPLQKIPSPTSLEEFIPHPDQHLDVAGPYQIRELSSSPLEHDSVKMNAGGPHLKQFSRSSGPAAGGATSCSTTEAAPALARTGASTFSGIKKTTASPTSSPVSTQGQGVPQVPQLHRSGSSSSSLSRSSSKISSVASKEQRSGGGSRSTMLNSSIPVAEQQRIVTAPRISSREVVTGGGTTAVATTSSSPSTSAVEPSLLASSSTKPRPARKVQGVGAGAPSPSGTAAPASSSSVVSSSTSSVLRESTTATGSGQLQLREDRLISHQEQRASRNMQSSPVDPLSRPIQINDEFYREVKNSTSSKSTDREAEGNSCSVEVVQMVSSNSTSPVGDNDGGCFAALPFPNGSKSLTAVTADNFVNDLLMDGVQQAGKQVRGGAASLTATNSSHEENLAKLSYRSSAVVSVVEVLGVEGSPSSVPRDISRASVDHDHAYNPEEDGGNNFRTSTMSFRPSTRQPRSTEELLGKPDYVVEDDAGHLPGTGYNPLDPRATTMIVRDSTTAAGDHNHGGDEEGTSRGEGELLPVSQEIKLLGGAARGEKAASSSPIFDSAVEVLPQDGEEGVSVSTGREQRGEKSNSDEALDQTGRANAKSSKATNSPSADVEGVEQVASSSKQTLSKESANSQDSATATTPVDPRELKLEINRLKFKLKDSVRVRDQWKKQHTTTQLKMRQMESELTELKRATLTSTADLLRGTSNMAVDDGALPGNGSASSSSQPSRQRAQTAGVESTSGLLMSSGGGGGMDNTNDSQNNSVLSEQIEQWKKEKEELEKENLKKEQALKQAMEKLQLVQQEKENLEKTMNDVTNGGNNTTTVPTSSTSLTSPTDLRNQLIAQTFSQSQASQGTINLSGAAAPAGQEQEGTTDAQTAAGLGKGGISAAGAGAPPQTKGAPAPAPPSTTKGPSLGKGGPQSVPAPPPAMKGTGAPLPVVPKAMPIKGKGKGKAQETKTNGLVNIHWRPAKELPTSGAADPNKFLESFLKYNQTLDVECDGVPVKLEFLDCDVGTNAGAGIGVNGEVHPRRRTIYSLEVPGASSAAAAPTSSSAANDEDEEDDDDDEDTSCNPPSSCVSKMKPRSESADPRGGGNNSSSSSSSAKALPDDILTEYFQKKRATVDLTTMTKIHATNFASPKKIPGTGHIKGGHHANGSNNGGGVHGFNGGQKQTVLLDEKRIRMLEILLQRQKMTTGLSGKDSIRAIKNAFLSCDYDLVPLDSLVIVRNVHIVHVELGEPVRKFVEQNSLGCSASSEQECIDQELLQLDHPFCHLLVWEVCCKVPALEQRLECMMFASNFEQFYDNAMQRLNIAYNGLLTIYRKRMFCALFFQTAKRLGNQLNKGSNVSTIEDQTGFELSALEKLAQTKSSAEPRATLYHFILCLMNITEENQMFSQADMRRLDLAKTVRAFGVYDQCSTLVESLAEIEKVVETGEYKNRETGISVQVDKRRLTMMPTEYDQNDQFQDVMGTFVENARDRASQIAVYACNVFQTYKELGIFFDDVGSLWPPPSEASGSKDLFQIMFDFSNHCSKAFRDLEGPGLRPLREKIVSRLELSANALATRRRNSIGNNNDDLDSNNPLEDSFLSDGPDFVLDRRASVNSEMNGGGAAAGTAGTSTAGNNGQIVVYDSSNRRDSQRSSVISNNGASAQQPGASSSTSGAGKLFLEKSASSPPTGTSATGVAAAASTMVPPKSKSSTNSIPPGRSSTEEEVEINGEKGNKVYATALHKSSLRSVSVRSRQESRQRARQVRRRSSSESAEEQTTARASDTNVGGGGGTGRRNVQQGSQYPSSSSYHPPSRSSQDYRYKVSPTLSSNGEEPDPQKDRGSNRSGAAAAGGAANSGCTSSTAKSTTNNGGKTIKPTSRLRTSSADAHEPPWKKRSSVNEDQDENNYNNSHSERDSERESCNTENEEVVERFSQRPGKTSSSSRTTTPRTNNFVTMTRGGGIMTSGSISSRGGAASGSTTEGGAATSSGASTKAASSGTSNNAAYAGAALVPSTSSSSSRPNTARNSPVEEIVSVATNRRKNSKGNLAPMRLSKEEESLKGQLLSSSARTKAMPSGVFSGPPQRAVTPRTFVEEGGQQQQQHLQPPARGSGEMTNQQQHNSQSDHAMMKKSSSSRGPLGPPPARSVSPRFEQSGTTAGGSSGNYNPSENLRAPPSSTPSQQPQDLPPRASARMSGRTATASSVVSTTNSARGSTKPNPFTGAAGRASYDRQNSGASSSSSGGRRPQMQQITNMRSINQPSGGRRGQQTSFNHFMGPTHSSTSRVSSKKSQTRQSLAGFCDVQEQAVLQDLFEAENFQLSSDDEEDDARQNSCISEVSTATLKDELLREKRRRLSSGGKSLQRFLGGAEEQRNHTHTTTNSSSRGYNTHDQLLSGGRGAGAPAVTASTAAMSRSKVGVPSYHHTGTNGASTRTPTTAGVHLEHQTSTGNSTITSNKPANLRPLTSRPAGGAGHPGGLPPRGGGAMGTGAANGMMLTHHQRGGGTRPPANHPHTVGTRPGRAPQMAPVYE